MVFSEVAYWCCYYYYYYYYYYVVYLNMPTFYVTVISAFPITSLSVSFGRSCSELKYSGLHLFQNALAKHCDSGDFIWKILSMLFFSVKKIWHTRIWTFVYFAVWFMRVPSFRLGRGRTPLCWVSHVSCHVVFVVLDIQWFSMTYHCSSLS